MMSSLRRTWERALAILKKDALDRDLDAELASHLALAADDYERQGMSAEAARRKAALKLGSRAAAVERQRDARGFPTLDSLVRDVRHALRGFRREPSVAAIAVSVLALGIGANTAVFSVVNPLLLRPLPFKHPEQLVWVANDGPEGLSGKTFPVDVYEDFGRYSQAFSDWTSYFAFFGFDNPTLTGQGDPERVSALGIGPRFFEVLGVMPAYGRAFTGAELLPNGPRAVILGHGLWRRRFAANPDIIGQAVRIDREPFTVVGVMPASFDFSSVFTPGVRVDLFQPAILDEMRTWGNTLAVVGRLRAGVTLDEARAEFRTFVPQIAAARPNVWRVGATLTPLKEHVSGGMRLPLLVLWGAVGLVLLIVCANLANLLLARATARSREFAVRLALGATRGRLIRQLLIEGLALSASGAALGVPLALALTAWLTAGDLQNIPLLYRVKIDAAALLLTAGVSVVAAIAFSILPALKVSPGAPQAALQEQSRGVVDSPRQAWIRRSLVVAEIALATVLLIGAGLLGRSFVRLLDVDLGFQTSRAFATRLDLTWQMQPDERRALRAEVLRRVAALPGVEAAGVSDALPLDRNRTVIVRAPHQSLEAADLPSAFRYTTSQGYLAAMGIPLVSGRDFNEADTGKAAVAMVNETLAKLLYPELDPIGRPVLFGQQPLTIVGVAADVRQNSLDENPVSQLYLPVTQTNTATADLVVRTALAPAALTASLRRVLADLDPRLVTTDVRAIEDLVERALSPRRFLVSLLSGFSLLAVVLASLGIYGVVSYSVNQRVSEIGVRMALGATAGDVRRQVLGTTLWLASMGIALGTAASLALTRLIASLLFGTSPTDPLTFASTIVVLTIVAVIAGYAPARRASRIDPMRALRAG
jgi:predicted permease